MSEKHDDSPEGSPTRIRLARPKYQVFVSSTFMDLHAERQAVTWEILKAGHIPVGMENFSAYDDRGWKVINRTLENTDYYVMIVAGRYGSVDPDLGISWTEREYQRALELGIPVLAFIREKRFVPGDQVDTDEKAAKLAALIEHVSSRRLRETWTTPDDLRAKVSVALLKAISEDEAEGSERPGWFRGTHLPKATTTDEFARLSAENRRLREELHTARRIEESPIAPFIVQLGTGESPEDRSLVIGCVVENHGSVPFTIRAAQAKWWFTATSKQAATEPKATETRILQYGAQPGEKCSINAILLMTSEERSVFGQRIKSDRYTSPVEVELEITCESPGGASRVLTKIVNWPVQRRPRKP